MRVSERIEAINEVSENLRDETITATLTAEPDTARAGELLTASLTSVAQRVLPSHMELRIVSASVTMVGRNHRIMIGDWLARENKGTTIRTLAKCTAIGECEQRRRVRDWNGETWGKEHVVYGSDEHYYRVISGSDARRLAPEAFPSAEAMPTPSEGL
jgi:hypothetical protein